MEAKALTGATKPEDQADEFLGYGAANVVIKLGKEGCLIKNRKMSKRVPGFQVEVIDTTGAGDNFVAGFIMGLSSGLEIEECARLGNAAGAITVQSLGSNGAVQSVEQLRDFIKAQETEKFI
jgi:sugar/nucleoside kinase (ribokinase family)